MRYTWKLAVFLLTLKNRLQSSLSNSSCSDDDVFRGNPTASGHVHPSYQSWLNNYSSFSAIKKCGSVQFKTSISHLSQGFFLLVAWNLLWERGVDSAFSPSFFWLLQGWGWETVEEERQQESFDQLVLTGGFS